MIDEAKEKKKMYERKIEQKIAKYIAKESETSRFLNLNPIVC